MIGWDDVYKVVVAMVPLYVALILGYGAVRWWHIFTREQCDAVNLLVCYFTLPLFTFEFTATVNPYEMNYHFIGADVISKGIVVATIASWAKWVSRSSSYSWSITSYCLSTLNNTLVVGVPLMKAMYGQMGVDLVVQASVVQALFWITLLLFVLEFRQSRTDDQVSAAEKNSVADLEENSNSSNTTTNYRQPPSFWLLLKVVWQKLAKNPNSYACIVGIIWALLSKKWHFRLPSIMEESILIMSRAGTGTAMFSIGLFTGVQERVIACGAGLTLFGMVLRFVAGPAAMAIGAVAVGLRGNVLRIAIIQAAMPQSITSFIFAKQYGLHADVISTAVIFGTMMSLPVLIAYYAALESLH